MRIAAGILVGWAVAGLVATALGVLQGALAPWTSALALLAGLVAAAWATKACPPALVAHPLSRADVIAVASMAAVGLRQFLWLTFEKEGALYVLLPYNYGDLPLHWTYVEYLVRGARFWPENPIFTGERLHYPIGVDLLTALLVQVGLPIRAAFATLGLLGAGLLAFALLVWGRGFAVAGFLFSGGLFGLDALRGALERDPHGAIAWKNLFLALFMPQRGFLFALPAGLLLLWSFRERLIRAGRGLPPWVEGGLWGAMPLFHAHTFLFVSLVVGAWALWRRKVTLVLPALAVAILPAAFSTWQVTEGLRAGSVFWWKTGWVIGAQNPLMFLATNFGLFLPLLILTAIEARRPERVEARFLLWPGGAIFAALFFVMLAPWDWDNTKLMLWCYVLVLPPIGERLLDLRPALRWGCLVVLFTSGAIAVGASCLEVRAASIVDLEERAAVCEALRDLPAGERTATVQTFNHPVALCGHALVAGYGGHLWSHGIDSKAVEEDLAALMRGEQGWEERARRIRARYVFWGRREVAAYGTSLEPWAVEPPVAEGRWGRLYALPR